MFFSRYFLLIITLLILTEYGYSQAKDDEAEIDQIAFGNLEFTNIPTSSFNVEKKRVSLDGTTKFIIAKFNSGNLTLKSKDDPNRTILKGIVQKVELEYYHTEGNKIFFEIDQNKALIEFKCTYSNVPEVLGGNISFVGRTLIFNNSEEIYISKKKSAGKLTWNLNNVSIESPKLKVNKDTYSVINDEIRSSDNVTFQYDFTDNEICITEAEFIEEDINIDLGNYHEFSIDDISFELKKLSIDKLIFTISPEKPCEYLAVFESFKIDGRKFSHDNNPKISGKLDKPFSSDIISFSGRLSSKSVNLTDVDFYAASINLTDINYQDAGGFYIKANKCILQFDTLTNLIAIGNFNLNKCHSILHKKSDIDGPTIIDFKELKLTFNGNKNRLIGSGNININEMSLAKKTEVDISKVFNECNLPVPFRFSARVPNISGDIDLENGLVGFNLVARTVNGKIYSKGYTCEYHEKVKAFKPVIELIEETYCTVWEWIPFIGDECKKVAKRIREEIKLEEVEVNVPLRLNIQLIDTEIKLFNVIVKKEHNSNDVELCGGSLEKIEPESLLIVSVAPDINIEKHVDKVLDPIIDLAVGTISQKLLYFFTALFILDDGVLEDEISITVDGKKEVIFKGVKVLGNCD